MSLVQRDERAEVMEGIHVFVPPPRFPCSGHWSKQCGSQLASEDQHSIVSNRADSIEPSSFPSLLVRQDRDDSALPAHLTSKQNITHNGYAKCISLASLEVAEM